MEKRKLGKTDMQTSLLGIGGFHLLETPLSDVDRILHTYLDHGGNYIETAYDYGQGISERKIGKTVHGMRNHFYLATKCIEKQNAGKAAEMIEASLRNLKTDYVDIMFVHALQSMEELEALLAPKGAMEAIQKAQKQGKIRYIGVSGHGRPHVLLEAVRQYHFDVLMTGINYYDRFNFPASESELLPLCLEKRIGFLAMKSIADGFLHQSAEKAVRYVKSLPVSTIVMGINTMDMLEKDLNIIENGVPLSQTEKEALYREAPELGDYVCRLCGECSEPGFDPSEYFLLEGLFDRQMDRGIIESAPQYALRERLKHWFLQADLAAAEYTKYQPIDPGADFSRLNEKCPYGIDIGRKLKLTHQKLSGWDYLF